MRMATRGRGAKRSIDGAGQGAGNFVFAPNVDLNAAAHLAAGGPPALGVGGPPGDNNAINAFPGNSTMNSMSDANINIPVSVGGSPAGSKKNDRRHRCNICGKMFNRPSSLKIHLTTHTGERPFPCPYPGCGRAFNVSSNMRRHFRTHNNAGGEDGHPAPPATASDYGNHEQQLQQPQQLQQSPAWNVNMYNPGGAGVPIPRAKGKRVKGSTGASGGDNQNGNEGNASEGADTGELQVGGPAQQSMHPYPPFGIPGPYPGFPPAPIMNIPGLPGMPDLFQLPDFQHMPGVPMGVQMMPIELALPVDPALTRQNAEGDADADAEGDEDADEDADGENDGDGDGEGETDDSNRPQLTHSTSNTRASNNTSASKGRTSARVQSKAKASGATSGATRGRGRPPKAGSGVQGQQQVQFRQILVPVSVPLTGDPSQAQRIAQQYQQQYAQYAKYAQYAQYYMQQQAQAQAQTGQTQTPVHQVPQTTQVQVPPDIHQPVSDTSAQRLGPVTSAERTIPSGAPQTNIGNTGMGEFVGRSVFVHWGPKEAKEKPEIPQNDAAMQALADSAASAAKVNETSANEQKESGNGEVSAAEASKSTDASSAEASNSKIEQSNQGTGSKTGEADAVTSSPRGERDDEEGDGEEGMDVDEGGDADGPNKPDSSSSPRGKRRKVGRPKGRGRR